MAQELHGQIVLTSEFSEALASLHRGDNVFLTGRAGTGKSTLIRKFVDECARNVIVAAPTGIAALNVGGYTLHSLFSLRPSTTIDEVQSSAYRPRNGTAMGALDTLIIDEASMVRADLLDMIDAALRRFGPQPGRPFGGVQIVLVGDLFQLPPVMQEREREHFTTRYETPFFFSADAYDHARFRTVELTTVFRQTGDDQLVDVLNAVREGRMLDEQLVYLNRRVREGFTPPAGERWLTLTTTNRIAEARNKAMLEQLPGDERVSRAVVSGDLDDGERPAAEELPLRVGAQVMLLTNDPMRRWVNGTIGRVIGMVETGEGLEADLLLDDGTTVTVPPHTWEVTRPRLGGRGLVHEVVGTYTQLPLRLAWAITIHKSQGQSLDHAVIDLSGGTFADGQLYVALSRLRTLEGLVLSRPVQPKDLKVSQAPRRLLVEARASGEDAGAAPVAYVYATLVGDRGWQWRPRSVEVGIVTGSGRELETLIHAGRDLGSLKKTHGISAEDLRLAPRLIDAWPAIAEFLAGHVIVGVDVDDLLSSWDFELKNHGLLPGLPLGVAAAAPSAGELQEIARRRGALAAARALQASAEGEVDRTQGTLFTARTTSEVGYLKPRRADRDLFIVRHERGEPAVELARLLEGRESPEALEGRALRVLQAVQEQGGREVWSRSGQRQESIEGALVPGATVCFSGSAVDLDGREVSKEELQTLAEGRGLIVETSVTKKRTDALIVAEYGSQSGKAKNARAWGKPVFDVSDFLVWAAGGSPRSRDTADRDRIVVEINGYPGPDKRLAGATEPRPPESHQTSPVGTLPVVRIASLQPGMRVHFAGIVTDPGTGERITHAELRERATAAGLRLATSLSVRGTDALIYSPERGGGTQIDRASTLGIPLLPAQAFLEWCGRHETQARTAGASEDLGGRGPDPDHAEERLPATEHLLRTPLPGDPGAAARRLPRPETGVAGPAPVSVPSREGGRQRPLRGVAAPPALAPARPARFHRRMLLTVVGLLLGGFGVALVSPQAGAVAWLIALVLLLAWPVMALGRARRSDGPPGGRPR